MFRNFLLGLLFFKVISIASAQPSPREFLGYELGSKFTPHHRMVAYLAELAHSTNTVKVHQYGTTPEGRPLQVAYISAPQNLAQLDEIRLNNLRAAGLESGSISGKYLPVVWLSYNVHGNEASASEAGLGALHYLATHKDAAAWRDNLVIILDLCINPDGRDRYAHWFAQRDNGSPELDSWEHQEPYPSGRFNHYLFDLNRDWAWATQSETKARLALYQQWLPHLHADFHEMNPNSPYFFAPAARPFHYDISTWQREFQQLAGRNHAKYFDQNNWLYYTKEVYDLFYPSYGDTYPTFNGAMGFTYEQGGSGRAGTAVITQNGDTLTLRQRYEHHYTVSLSTVEIAFEQRERLLREFKKYFDKAQNNPAGNYKTYLLKGSKTPSKLAPLLQLLDRHQIRYGSPTQTGASVRGFAYLKNQQASTQIEKNDVLISAYQPKSQLLKILFEPSPALEDSLTYDLTAWGLPFAHGIETYALTERLNVGKYTPTEAQQIPPKSAPPYAYLVAWQGTSAVRFLAQLLQKGFKVRFAQEPFKLNGQQYDYGTLIINRGENTALGNSFDTQVQQTAQEVGLSLSLTSTGLVESGKDLGSDELGTLTAPKIALVGGEGTNPTEMGALWHYFAQDISYPINIIPLNSLNKIDLKKYSVVVLPSGNYQEYGSILIDFAQKGGRIIATDDAVEIFARDNRTNLHKQLTKLEGEEKKDNSSAKDEKLLQKYAHRYRRDVSESVAGAIFKVEIDHSHPLGYGLQQGYFTLKNNRTAYPYLTGGWNVGVLRRDAHVSGFVGHKLKERFINTLAVGVEYLGRGKVVYLPESPVFRGFWESGKVLLGNAVFLDF